ncbi:MAG TPA: histidine kinase [Chitinophagaceae bacterium]|nr:tetratricopeptide repeat protein [Chitinophagaceae bacterium]MCB9054260.1 tetratricopeptide repeat protein [Chitinophagales bacterium]HPG11896.1 histidine kinase [Chitinophagaceae bacterium]
MRYWFHKLTVATILSVNVSAQQNTSDSLLFKKATDAFAIAFRNSDSAMLLAGQALYEAKRLNNNRAIANAYNSIGWAYMHKGRFDSSLFNLHKARDLFNTNKNDYDVARVDINLAEVYTKQNQISSAIQYLLQADTLSNKINNIPLQTDVKRQLAIVYRESGDYKGSAAYFRQALEGFDKQKDYFRYVNTSVSLSILYRNMSLMDSSLSVLKRSLQIATQQAGTPYQVAMVHENLGETYFNEKQFGEALKHYTIAYNVFQKLNNQADLAFEAFCVGKTLKELHKYDEAEKYLMKSYTVNDSLEMINYQADAAGELAELYKVTGNWQQAYEYLSHAAALKDSVGLQEQIEKTNALKEKFETEKKEQEIALLQTKNDLAAADNRRTRAIQYILIILFVAAVAIGWLLLNRFRIKKKLEQQLLRNRIAGDLHDDIGSTLSSIDISSRIALVKKDDPVVVSEQLTKIRQHARKTMDSMSDIVWSINPGNDNMESMLARMQEFAAELCEPQQIELRFEPVINAHAIVLDADKRKNIFLVFKEAVNNALKYSQCNLLGVMFSKTNTDQLLMRITDNGKGFDEEQIKKGNGLENMRSRAKHLGGQLSITSIAGKGTAIELLCPLK